MTQTHEECYQLLPWYVNGTLEEAQARLVSAHLNTCAICAAETTALHKLEDTMAALGEEHADAAEALALRAAREARAGNWDPPTKSLKKWWQLWLMMPRSFFPVLSLCLLLVIGIQNYPKSKDQGLEPSTPAVMQVVALAGMQRSRQTVRFTNRQPVSLYVANPDFDMIYPQLEAVFLKDNTPVTTLTMPANPDVYILFPRLQKEGAYQMDLYGLTPTGEKQLLEQYPFEIFVEVNDGQ